jgi:Ca2+/Na+ antiporter
VILQILAIIAGVAMLVFGGDGLVRGAVGIAARLRMPPSLIGLTIVAMGTSMPELVVSIGAAVGGQPDLSIGNVVGSNIYNICLILGITAMIRRLTCDLGDIRHDGAWMIGASALFIGVAWDGLLGRLDALAMLAVMGGFLWSAIRRNKAVAPPRARSRRACPDGLAQRGRFCARRPALVGGRRPGLDLRRDGRGRGARRARDDHRADRGRHRHLAA